MEKASPTWPFWNDDGTFEVGTSVTAVSRSLRIRRGSVLGDWTVAAKSLI